MSTIKADHIIFHIHEEAELPCFFVKLTVTSSSGCSLITNPWPSSIVPQRKNSARGKLEGPSGGWRERQEVRRIHEEVTGIKARPWRTTTVTTSHCTRD